MKKIEIKIPGCFFCQDGFKEIVYIDYEGKRVKFKDTPVNGKESFTDVDFSIYPQVFLRFKDVGLFDEDEG